MTTPSPESVTGYLASLPDDRRKALEAVRKVIRKNLPKGYAEGVQYRMIGYFVPHTLYPAGYHCDPKQPLPFASLASQKNHMALYLFCTYGNEAEQAWFREAWTAAGNPLDMGKGCVRFKKLEDVPLEVIGEAVARMPVEAFVASYESNLPPNLREKHLKRKAKLEAAGAAAPKAKAAATGTPKKVAKKAPKKTAKKPAAKKASKKTAKKASGRVSKKAAR